MMSCESRLFPPRCRRSFPALRAADFLFLWLLALNLRADQFDDLRNYWLNQLVGTNLSSSTLTSRATTASNYWNTMNTGASRTSLWSDVPLGSVSANVTTHFSRLQAMALAWATPGCSLQGSASLAAALTNGLDWMCANSYTTAATEYNNWWDWEIGGLQNFNNAAVLIYPALTAGQVTNYNNSVDHYQPPNKSWMTGANLTDQCKGMIIRGILGKNSGKMGTAQTNLSPVFLYVTTSDGFYRDGSFVQHTHIAYTGTYGIVLLGDVAQLVNLLNGSTWQITDPNLTNVFNWVTASYQPVIYHGAMMEMVRGRAISRYSETASSDGSSAINDIKQIAQFAPTNRAVAFSNWTVAPFLSPGQYQFADMDRAVAWRSNFCFGLSMSSSRIANYESINGENLHGWFTGAGMTYLYLGNTETQFTGDFWPTVDPYHLPGTTEETVARADSSREATTTGQTWVGGAQVSGSYGTAGMSLSETNSLVAKKSWFMFDNEVVCLGAGITCGDPTEVDTTVENRRLGTAPTNNFIANGTRFAPGMGWSSNLTSVSWCSLDGVAGYYFPGGATNLVASFDTNTGAWIQINNGTYVGATTNLYTDDYLTLWFNHGVKPTNATYAYVVLPNFSSNNMTVYAASPDIVVLTNTSTVQAASKPGLGLVAANFWLDGTNSADLITVNKKSSVTTCETGQGIAVGISDPTQTNSSTIKLTLNRSAIRALNADPGVTVLQLSPQIVFSINVNGSLGQTYQASFLYPAPTVTWDANTISTGAQDGSGTWTSVATNWWNGAGNVAWNDATPYVAAFGTNGTAGMVTLSAPHNAFALLFSPVGSDAYVLSGTGPLTVSNGITANASATVSVPMSLGADQTWIVASNQILTVNGAVNSPLSTRNLSLAGPGTVNLAGTNQFTTNIASLNFVDTQNRTVLAIAGGPETIGVLNLNDGVTNTVSGAGTLIVNGAGDLRVGGETSGAAQLLDMAGLNNFAYNAPANTFSVGGQSSSITGSGTVYLATNSTITAGVFGVQNVTGSTATQSSGTLYLGRNTTINASTINIGLTRDPGLVKFQSGVAAPTLVIRASDGAGRANLTIGTRSSSYFGTATTLVDLTNNVVGTSALDALVGALQIANETYCLTTSDVLNGTFIMGGGSFDATAITIGLKSSVASQSLGNVNGTFTQGGGAVKVATLTLGDRTAGNTNLLNATYNFNGGALNAQTITPGANAATRNFNWNAGTIGNYDPNTDLTIAAGVNVVLNSAATGIFNIASGRTATVNSVISGGGALLASGGTGTLILGATNTYAGPTTVASGTLRVNGALTNIVTVAAGTTLGGSGTSSGTTTIQSGGTIQATNGTFTVGKLNLGDSPNATTYSDFATAAGGKVATINLAVSGTNVINIRDAIIAVGTNTLITYAGAIGGSGFTGFKLGTLPALPTGTGALLKNNGSAIQFVVVTLTPPVLVGTPSYAAGGLSFSFTGANGQTYRVLTSTNAALPLTNWQSLSSGTFGAGAVNFTDPAATNAQQFYRIASP